MKVAMLLWSCFPDREGGAEKQCRRLAVELKQRGVDCLLVVSRPFDSAPCRESWEGGEVLRLGRRVPAMNRIIGWLRRRLARVPSKALLFWLELPFQWIARMSFLSDFHRWRNTEEARAIQVFHAHEAIWLAGLAVETAGRTGASAWGKATSDHPLDPVGYDIPFRGKWARLRLRAAYIAPSGHLKQKLAQRGIPESRIFTIPNGVPLPAETSPRTHRQDVLYVGNLSQGARYKAFDVLFEAWKQVQSRYPQARLNVLGGGETEYWADVVAKKGCTSSVRFLGYQADPSPWFREAGCFVLPSRKEGMSNALLEAQAWGLPCVVSDIPANRAVATDGENAVLVPAGDAAALAEGIGRLLGDEALCRQLGDAARRNAEQRFDIRVTAGQLLDAYRQGIADSLAGGRP